MGEAYPIYLVVTPFSELAQSVRVLVRTLDKLEPYLPMAEGYYREDTDEALIGLQFDGHELEELGVPRLLDAVRRCHLPMIVPERLGEEQRARFTENHLCTYHTYMQQYRSPGPGPSLIERVFTALEEHVAGVLEQAGEYESLEVSASGPGQVERDGEGLTHADQGGDGNAAENLADERDAGAYARPTTRPRTREERATSEWEMAVDGLMDESSLEI